MRIASIDIGTNTALMLIADIDRNGAVNVVSDDQAVVRIGKDVDKDRRINDEAFARCVDALIPFRESAKSAGVDRIVVTGTSALRDAANREEFINRVGEETGLRIEVLSGEDEAHWTYAGAIAGLQLPSKRAAVLDIGGGSTELTLGEGATVSDRRSLDIGCVRLTERFLSGPPPKDEELDALVEYIRTEIARYPDFDPNDVTFLGVAGTVTTLAAVDLGLDEYDRKKVSGKALPLARIDELYEQFRPLNHEQLVTNLKVDPGRADIILTGIIILREVMRAKGLTTVTVSAQGLRYGIALRESMMQ